MKADIFLNGSFVSAPSKLMVVNVLAFVYTDITESRR